MSLFDARPSCLLKYSDDVSRRIGVACLERAMVCRDEGPKQMGGLEGKTEIVALEHQLAFLACCHNRKRGDFVKPKERKEPEEKRC